MTLSQHTRTAPRKREALPLSDSGRNMSLLNLGGPGAGKTTLETILLTQSLRRGFPGITFDPNGSLAPALISRLLRNLQHVSDEEAEAIWRRIRIIDVGNPQVSVPFPIYYQGSARSLWQVSARFLRVLRLAYPKLVSEAPVTWPRIRRVGIMAGCVLASLSYQLTEIEDLLFNTLEWEKSGKFTEAVRRNPEEAGAVSYFREQYLPLSKSAKSELISPLLDHVFPFVHDPQYRSLFGASTPGLLLQDVQELGEEVVFDFHQLTDPETKRFAMLWIFNYVDEFLQQWGRKDVPFVVTVDEFAAMTQQVTDGVNPLAVLIDTLIQQFCRQNNIWFNCSFQSLNQIDSQLRNTLLGVGTIIAGRITTITEARLLADVLFRTNPYTVKQIRRVWGREDGYYTRPAKNVVIDQFNEFMNLTEQQEQFAKRLVRLPQFSFLCRLATREGEVADTVIPISIADVARDSLTGADIAPDQDMVNRVRDRLVARSGIPVATINKELEARLLPGTIHHPDTAPLLPEQAGHPRRHIPQGSQQAPADRPTLDEHQQAMLAYLVSHPDSPVTEVYKGLGIGAGQGTRLRDSLKALGLVAELELRTGSTRGGRPARLLIPSFAAWELVGKDPPSGRGGVLHRHIQQMVVSGAKAKGYRTEVEHKLETGTIVDVALATGDGCRIAVEIAIGSRPEREITHISNCLRAGFAKVYTVFADEHLLGRTATALQAALPEEALQHVRLLPLQQLGQVG
jgi:hypothetical protein